MKYFAIIFILLGLGLGCEDGQTRSNTPLHDAHNADDRDITGDAADLTDATDAANDIDRPRGDASTEDIADLDSTDTRQDTGASTDDAGALDADEPDAPADNPDVRIEPDIAEPTGPFVLWMAPNGSDSRDGTSRANAVLTMGRVQEILKASAPETDVEVRIAPGRYRGQKVKWTFSVPGHTVTFTRLEGEEDRPVFDGCLSASNCPGGTWFILQRSDGAETGIVFNYLRVENYQTAISLNGNRNAEAKSNGSNTIYGCYFYRIGNVFNSAVKPSTAAVRLVNSDDNLIRNNHFVDIINTRSPGILHAIYAAHMSDRNQILNNRFYNNAGDPVRLRDYSNDNVINNNTFKKVATSAAYSEWYCDHDTRSDCTKASAECPSWGNQFRDNHLSGTYACARLPVFKYHQDDSATGCSPPSPGARRLRTSGNTSASTPCQ